jgi:hypothetical protein
MAGAWEVELDNRISRSRVFAQSNTAVRYKSGRIMDCGVDEAALSCARSTVLNKEISDPDIEYNVDSKVNCMARAASI